MEANKRKSWKKGWGPRWNGPHGTKEDADYICTHEGSGEHLETIRNQGIR